MLRSLVNKFSSLENRNAIFVFSRFKNTVALSEEYDIEEIEDAVDNEEEDKLKEDLIQQKRNKSRLRQDHYNLLHNTLPYEQPMLDFHKTVKYQRRIYGVFGESSGVDPKICWPSTEDIAHTKEYEDVAYPYTIRQIMEENARKKQEFEANRQKRQNDIVKKFAKLEQMKKDLQERIVKKEAEARAVKDRKDRLVEEVRRHFGFKIDHRDERFKEMLEKKEKAEKKADKEAKRKMKEARYMAKLQSVKEDGTIEDKDTAKTPDKS